MQNSREPDFFVAEWRICPVLGRLERGDAAISVEPRSMQVLGCLARHAPNMVSKQRLIHEVWGDAFVTEEVLSHAVWELRKAFGDEARNPRYIQTISRRGYRLLAPVTFGVPPEPLVRGSRIAHYEILELLGAGAMGEVYKARDQRLGRIVALKFLPAELARDPSARRRFLHEAQAVAQLDHPNVATIYEVGESEGGRAYLALAFYEGETLQRKLERGPLPLAEAVGIARQIAQGLGAAHQRQIVHRDVKPANIAVLPDGTVKLLDFGLAKMIGATSLTRLGASPGTPAYKSPEQTRGEKVDRRSDLWALGVVLYEMLAGRQPFRGEYEQAVIYSILNETQKPLGPELPPELSEVIDRALKRDPAERYGSAEELKEDLEVIPLGEVSASRKRPRRRATPKWKGLAAGLAALVVLGILLGTWDFSPEVARRIVRVHRTDFSPEVARWIVQGDRVEGQDDTKRILSSAEQSYRLALQRDPFNPVVKAYLAALLCRMEAQFPAAGRRQEIRQLTDQAVQDAPGHPMPWVARTRLLLLENKALEAEQAARQAIKQDPRFDRGYIVLVEALIAQGRLEEGFRQILRAGEVDRGYRRQNRLPQSQLPDFKFQEANRRRNEATVELRKILDYHPDHPTAAYKLALIYLESGRYFDALPLFRKAFDKSHDPRLINSLGLIYLKLDRMPEAIESFKQVYELEADPTTARNLAECYEKTGQKEEARRWYETALRGFDKELARGGRRDDYLLYLRSFCAAKLNRYDEALANIQEAMALMPGQRVYNVRAAQIYTLAGQRKEAYARIRQAVQKGYSLWELRNDPILHGFQDDVQLRAILIAH
jgi:DNA-binding winged helix-turn-helix (wHTH) protein/tetratricopeptide (TPR) repeat protein